VGSSPIERAINHLWVVFVCSKQANDFACVGTRTAELNFFSRKNKRAGAQANLSDGENLAEGETPIDFLIDGVL
jgi:hypothetical protein